MHVTNANRSHNQGQHFFLGQTASWVSVSDDKYDSDFEFLYAYVSQICLQ